MRYGRAAAAGKRNPSGPLHCILVNMMIAAAAEVLLEVVASYFVLTCVVVVVVVVLGVLVGLRVLVLVDAEQGLLVENQMLAYAELQHFVLKFVVVILDFVLVDAGEQGLLLVVESQMLAYAESQHSAAAAAADHHCLIILFRPSRVFYSFKLLLS